MRISMLVVAIQLACAVGAAAQSNEEPEVAKRNAVVRYGVPASWTFATGVAGAVGGWEVYMAKQGVEGLLRSVAGLKPLSHGIDKAIPGLVRYGRFVSITGLMAAGALLAVDLASDRSISDIGFTQFAGVITGAVGAIITYGMASAGLPLWVTGLALAGTTVGGAYFAAWWDKDRPLKRAQSTAGVRQGIEALE
ncbi:MAG: hypothetical protein HYY16_00885 [Planctomycetes bacterium]|nr:hypothetical protein [Planctomycetota bacterium]